MGLNTLETLGPRFVSLATFRQASEISAKHESASVSLVYLARGSGIVRVQDTEWPLLRGTACVSDQPLQVVGPVLHGWALALECEDCAAIEHRIPPGGVRRLPAGEATRCEGSLEALELELDRGQESADPGVIRALVHLVLVSYTRSPHADGADGQSRPAQTARAHQLVDEIRDVIEDRFSERLSLSDIAEALSRSPSSLHRAAKTVTGKTVLELIAEHRIKRAQELLLGTTLQVSEVAAQVGYPNVGHFHRAFRKNTSLTPRGWRAQVSRVLGE